MCMFLLCKCVAADAWQRPQQTFSISISTFDTIVIALGN